MPIRWFCLWTLWLLLPGGGSQSPSLRVPTGVPLPCHNEGEPIPVEQVSEGRIKSPCFRCFCRNGMVECDRERCAPLNTCPVLVPAPEKPTCCRRCAECLYAGVRYENDEHWRSTQDACRTLTCKCVTPCATPHRLIGYCCPVCPVANSAQIISEAEIQALTDPCVHCQCDDRWCHCYRTACPALDCPRDKQIKVPGRCCPECQGSIEAQQLTGGRCIFQGNTFEREQNFRPDQCTLCKCEDGRVICRRFVCPPIDCPEQRLFYDPRLCCPFCRDRDPLPCEYDGKIYKHEQQWSEDVCTNCTCANGETKCSTQSCPHPYGCPRGYKELKIPGKCCSTCEEKEATCTVFGDPHYTTFDGRAYNFQGTCRYVLAKECIRDFREPDTNKPPSFMVVAHNEPRGSKRFAWTHRLSVHIYDQKGKPIRISLLPRKKVKVNRRTIRLPYVRLMLFNVFMDGQGNILLTVTSAGLKVLWDGFSYVEVTVNAHFKGRLCGLCGNYNHDKSDDLTQPDGRETSSAHVFAQSWIYRSHRAYRKCSSARDRRYHKKVLQEQRRETIAHNNMNSLLTWAMLERDSNRSVNFGNINKEPGGSYLLVHNSSPKQNQTHLSTSLTLYGRNSKADKRKRKQRQRRRLRMLCSSGDQNRWKARRLAIAQCRLLKSDVFAPCRARVKVGRYFRWCIEDACACPASGRCYCESLLAYGRQCAQKNILIDWRPHSNCRSDLSCPMDGGVFSSCAPVCAATCSVPRPSCRGVCQPGCGCPSSTVLHDNKCIPLSLCPV